MSVSNTDISQAATDRGLARSDLVVCHFMVAQHVPPYQCGTWSSQSARPWEGLALRGGLKPLIPRGWIKFWWWGWAYLRLIA